MLAIEILLYSDFWNLPILHKLAHCTLHYHNFVNYAQIKLKKRKITTTLYSKVIFPLYIPTNSA